MQLRAMFVGPRFLQGICPMGADCVIGMYAPTAVNDTLFE